MAKIVGAGWVAEQLGQPEIVLVDPRRPMKYLSGHLPGAINVPVYQTFGPDGRLLSPDALAEFVGRCGIGDSSTPVLYDSPDGQNAAMLAWLLREERAPTMKPPVEVLPTVVLTNRQTRAIFLVTVIVLPGVVIGAGGIVWWRRRR